MLSCRYRFIVEDSWKKGKEGKEGRKKFYSLPPLSSCFLYIIVLVHTCSPLPLSSVFPLFTMLFFPVSNPSPFPSLYFVLTILNLSILHSSLFYSAYAFWLHHSRTQAHNTIIIRIYIPHPTPTNSPNHTIPYLQRSAWCRSYLTGTGLNLARVSGPLHPSAYLVDPPSPIPAHTYSDFFSLVAMQISG